MSNRVVRQHFNASRLTQKAAFVTSSSSRSTCSLNAPQTRSLSASCRHMYPRDNNPKRGISPMRRTGLPRKLSVSDLPLPQPVISPKRHSKVPTDENHGLWGFFKDKKLLLNPEEEHAHGRAWTVEELRRKSWEDLHRLWWVCTKERNRIKTGDRERERLSAGYGLAESQERDGEVKRTMQAIKHTLTERFYAWEHARKIGSEDVTVNLTGDGPAYEPYKQALVEEADVEEEPTRENSPPGPPTKVL